MMVTQQIWLAGESNWGWLKFELGRTNTGGWETMREIFQ